MTCDILERVTLISVALGSNPSPSACFKWMMEAKNIYFSIHVVL